jgi:hypothetical protein
MRLLVLLMLTLAGSQGQTGPVSSDTAKWPRVRDEAHRVSFAYPPELRPVISPPEELRGLTGWVKRVLLAADAPGGADQLPILAVNVFVCDDPALSPRVPCQDETIYRSVCDRFEKFPLGDATAIQCVTYGRGACHWEAVVLREKSRVDISAPAANRELQEGATTRAACADAVVATRKQPLLGQVLASFQFR